ncbi:MAG: hypothetical protein CMJ46_06715 [Planctomyces sp.]|nr:hypothetical protein [Planctomyces sp.]
MNDSPSAADADSDIEPSRYKSLKFFLGMLRSISTVLLILSLIGWGILSLFIPMSMSGRRVSNPSCFLLMLYSGLALVSILFSYAFLRALIEVGYLLIDMEHNSRRRVELLESQTKAE